MLIRKVKFTLIKDINYIIGAVIVTCILFSCNELNSDIKIDKYQSGNIKFIKRYNDGMLDGESCWFFENGMLEQKMIYRKGKANGKAHYFYPSGALKSHRYWNEDKMTGYVADYWDDSVGIIKAVLLFNDSGDLIYRKNFDEQGNLLSEEGRKPE